MKDNKARFVIELDLKPEIYQMHILDKRFNVGQKMYNMLLNITSKRYNKMINDKRYKIIQNRLYELYDLRKDPEIDNKELRRIEKEINKGYTEQKILRNEFHLSEYAFHDDITAIQHKYKNHVDSFTAQKIASQQWKAYEKNILW